MTTTVGQAHKDINEGTSVSSLPPKSVRRIRNERAIFPTIPKNEMTPKVETAVSQLLREVERLENELIETKERVILLENIAEEDPLIPILNRRGFERELERAIAYKTRYNTDICLLYIDVDHFKSINDTHGHKAGDHALRHTASFLIHNIRQSDILARIGGDEFGLILHQAKKKEAEAKAIQLEKRIQKQPCKFEKIVIPIEISVGVAELQSNDSVVEIMDRADKTMYAIRRKRRIDQS